MRHEVEGTRIMVAAILALMISGLTLSFAATNCPPLHYRNGTFCVPCQKCSMGFGVKTPCTEKQNTVCQPCWPQYDYSNSTGFDPCILCDQNSNCLAGNPKVIKNCTIFSPTVCKGCAEGYYFDKDAGESGGCIECSPPCGVFEKEDRPCNTQHDRVCTRDTPVKFFPTESTSEYPKTSTDSVSSGGKRNTESDNGPSPEAEETSVPHSGAIPIHKKPWVWVIVCSVLVLISVPFVVFTAIKRRNGRSTGRGNTRPHSGAQFTQQNIPLMPRDCLDLPIKDLSVEQKRFISHLLNGKDPLEYYYWHRVADRVGLGKEAKAWGGSKNPTEAFLTAYGERDSTVRSLINALEEDELTHFAREVEERFSTARDDVRTARVIETHL